MRAQQRGISKQEIDALWQSGHLYDGPIRSKRNGSANEAVYKIESDTEIGRKIVGVYSIGEQGAWGITTYLG